MNMHGGFKIDLHGNTLKVTAYDAWNLETSLCYCREYYRMAAKLYSRPWACLCDLTNWELLTPDSIEPIIASNMWSKKHNLKYESIACGSPLHMDATKQVQSVLTETKIRHFNTLRDAEQWLIEIGLYTLESQMSADSARFTYSEGFNKFIERRQQFLLCHH